MSGVVLLLALATLSLNGTWDFKLLPGETNDPARVAWSSIDVPSNWEMKGFGTPRYGTDIEGKCISGEVGVYRRTFAVPTDWRGRIFLRFDGVMFGASVTLNGRTAADFTSSYNRHEFDVTPLLRHDAANEIVVRTHGFPKGAEFDTHDDWVLHGIFRDVSLICRPELHVTNWSLTTRLRGLAAEVSVRADLSGDGSVGWTLVSPDGRIAAAAEGLASQMTVADAALWSAETPNLYRLMIEARDRTGAVTERLTERVGLREIAWSGRVLRVNGRPVKLRGVDHHDLSPVNGRAITAAEQRRDAGLIKAANGNFVRTSHYPPSPAFLDACDELGIYLMDEVPFGYGDKHLTDATYGPLLLERAELTVRRDRNRPSVIVWSVGNENPVTEITRAAARRVRELDPSRPWCFPMQPNELMRNLAAKPPSDLGDLVNWHYPLVCCPLADVHRHLDSFDRPYVFGEYAHAYGTDFGFFEDYWTELRDDPAFAGGGVWMFQDQGILRKASSLSAASLRNQTWPDADHVYDTYGSYGTDGLVYSDRTPQTCYYEVRKVYAPIFCGRAFLPYPAGAGTNAWISVENRYDHLRLDAAVRAEWRLHADRSVVASGAFDVPPLAPHEKGFLTLDGFRRPTETAAVVWIEILFSDLRDGRRVYEKSYVLAEDLDAVRKTGSAHLAFDRASGRIRLSDDGGRMILDSPILVRTDRRSMIGKDRHCRFTPPREPLSVRLVGESEEEIDLAVAWSNVSGRVTFGLSRGLVRVSYELVPTVNLPCVEAGIAFALPPERRRFDWVGDGPYESYPHCSALSDFGVWSLDREDLYFPGNRAKVRLAAASSSDGSRLLLLPSTPSDVVFGRLGGAAIIGHNAFVGGKGSKFAPPVGRRTLRKGDRLVGSFELTVSSVRSDALDRLVGTPTPLVPFKPFHAVYDQD